MLMRWELCNGLRGRAADMYIGLAFVFSWYRITTLYSSNSFLCQKLQSGSPSASLGYLPRSFQPLCALSTVLLLYFKVRTEV
jgi:hypothetical protein